MLNLHNAKVSGRAECPKGTERFAVGQTLFAQLQTVRLTVWLWQLSATNNEQLPNKLRAGQT